MKKKFLIGAAIGATTVAAATAIILRYRQKIAEARGHVPIGKSWEDRQLNWEGWPGGFSIRP